jgi:predicted negative regulator of RcsB-dependent stress response
MADFDESPLDTATAWVQAYQKPILIGVGVVAVAVAGLTLVKRSGEQKRMNAERQYFEAQRAAGQNPQLAQTELAKVATRYAGTAAGDRAALMQAQLLLQDNKPADALAKLQALSTSGGAARLGSTLYSLMGAAYENLNKPKEAAETYLKAADATTFANEKAQRQADAARSWSVAGRSADAVNLWKALASDENNPMAAEARVRLGELAMKP